MPDVKTFKTYNFVTGAVDGTLAYDFSHPAYYPQEDYADLPRRRERRRSRTRQREWIKEDVRAEAGARSEARGRQSISLVSVAGAMVVIVLVTMVLLAQIRLTDISNTAAKLEDQITELETERDKLRVEYETIFNLKDVEEYAMEYLGMQEPDSSQIFYLTGVASGDKAVVVTQQQTDMFSLGVEDLFGSFQKWWGAITGRK